MSVENLKKFKETILEDGIIDADKVSQIKDRLYDDGVIDREEANFLFELNDAVANSDVKVADNSNWTALFVEALSDHVLKDEESPGTIDDDEANYLMERIGADGQIDDNELALLVNIASTATNESPINFNQYTLDAVKAAVVADGIVDAGEVEMMKKVIYGTGGAGGSDVSREEADMLFAINDATTDNEGHDASWMSFFVEAICKHVLEDKQSPNEIDEDEGEWLIAKIGKDGKVDANEKELMRQIKAKATKIEGKLMFQIEMWAG